MSERYFNQILSDKKLQSFLPRDILNICVSYLPKTIVRRKKFVIDKFITDNIHLNDDIDANGYRNGGTYVTVSTETNGIKHGMEKKFILLDEVDVIKRITVL
jgi:hypothetical protein